MINISAINEQLYGKEQHEQQHSLYSNYDYNKASPYETYNYHYEDYTPTRTGIRNRGHGQKYNYRYYNKPSMDAYQKVNSFLLVIRNTY